MSRTLPFSDPFDEKTRLVTLIREARDFMLAMGESTDPAIQFPQERWLKEAEKILDTTLPKPSILPLPIHKFAGLWARWKGKEDFYPVTIVSLRCNALWWDDEYRTPEWMLQYCEMLRTDGSVGPCGKEIQK